MEKANVVKSKSSNSAITTKSDNHSGNKKSRSNAEFQHHVGKKRGVYVEKKATNISIHKNTLHGKAAVAPKPPPRPKPGQKRFLASVLTILSKSTASTQFPEKETKKKTKVTRKVDTSQSLGIKDKPKYRSKILNDEMFKNLDQHNSLVLKYRNINNSSPSNFSETSYRTGEYLAKNGNLIRSDIGSAMSGEAKGVFKQVLEGLQLKKDKDVRIQEPATQMEKSNKVKDGENENLYKFFVDLLETTFSVYNVKAEYDAAPIESVGSSKVQFEIDEAVVNKLEPRKCSDDVITKPSNFYCVKDTNISGKNAVPEICIPPNLARPKPKRRLKTQSFLYTSKPNKKITDPNTEFIFPKKTVSKKAKKKTLINLFKKQLKMSYSDYEEPQTLYDALKVMARNKRKYQKSIRFDVPATDECFLKRPKIISSKMPRKCDNEDFCTYKTCTKKSYEKPDVKPEEKYSHHTLEVYGYDYDGDDFVRPSASVEKEVFLNQEAFTSDDEFDFDFENEIDMFGKRGEKK